MRFVQGRRLLTSLVKSYPRRQPIPRESRRLVDRRLLAGDPDGIPIPRPFVMEMIEKMKRLRPDEKLKFGYIFSEILGLPKPRPRKTKATPGDMFAVKLVSFDPKAKLRVLRIIVHFQTCEVMIKSLSELAEIPSQDCLTNLPSVIKQGVSKEEATEIVAEIKAAGGVAVMEPLE